MFSTRIRLFAGMLLLAAFLPARSAVQSVVIDGDHGKLSAVLHTPDDLRRPVPLVILCHGFGGSKEGMMEYLADELCRRGIAALRFDFNGHGQSEGRQQDMTVPNEVEDALAVYRYVASLPYVSRIGILGHSQGGVVASMAAGELGKHRLHAVCLLAPAAVLREDAIRGNTFGRSYDPLSPPEFVDLGLFMLGAEYIRTAFSLPIYETAARYQGPAMLVHGTADRVAPYSYSERYATIWKKAELHIMDGCDHGLGPRFDEATGYILDFFIRTLRPAKSRHVR